ncbi:MAG: c-type cytochrome [Bacteroidetes bacterium]|nr:c-type cytochrome [Bacteroidota bacterium]
MPVVLFIITAITCIGSAFTTTQSKPYTGGHKNLQVLPKDISDDSLDMIMDGFKAALNVKCSFCHVRNEAEQKMDFASDEKPEKEIARHMLRMTMDINARYFNFDSSTRADTISVVTCATCHRGTQHPDPESVASDMQAKQAAWKKQN